MQALEYARESPEAASDPGIRKILDEAIARIWGYVLAARPEIYVMTREQYDVFNYYQAYFHPPTPSLAPLPSSSSSSGGQARKDGTAAAADTDPASETETKAKSRYASLLNREKGFVGGLVGGSRIGEEESRLAAEVHRRFWECYRPPPENVRGRGSGSGSGNNSASVQDQRMAGGGGGGAQAQSHYQQHRQQ